MANLFDLLAEGRLPELRNALAMDPAGAKVRNASGASLLAQAVYMGNAEAVTLVKDALPTLDPYEAIMLGDADALRSALAHGWDANELAPDGFTPLGLAAFFKQREMFDMLLPLTRNVNQQAENPQRVAALHAATAARDAAMVEQLLRAGADPNLPQADGVLPIHASAQHGDAVITALLVLCGASPSARSGTGKSAIDHARDGGHGWLAERLSAIAESRRQQPHPHREGQLSP